jgi:hypothetical protein
VCVVSTALNSMESCLGLCNVADTLCLLGSWAGHRIGALMEPSHPVVLAACRWTCVCVVSTALNGMESCLASCSVMYTPVPTEVLGL